MMTGEMCHNVCYYCYNLKFVLELNAHRPSVERCHCGKSGESIRKKNDRVKHNNLILIVINKDFTERHWLTGDFLLC